MVDQFRSYLTPLTFGSIYSLKSWKTPLWISKSKKDAIVYWANESATVNFGTAGHFRWCRNSKLGAEVTRARNRLPLEICLKIFSCELQNWMILTNINGQKSRFKTTKTWTWVSPKIWDWSLDPFIQNKNKSLIRRYLFWQSDSHRFFSIKV